MTARMWNSPGLGVGLAVSRPGVADLAQEQRLRRLELTITRRLDGLLRGQYAGLLPGAGTEIAGSREYRPGEDEVRRMDWAVTARTALPHVRDTVADRELSTWLLVDATPRIFDRFWRRTEGSALGDRHTGLGLAIVRQIVESHGGRVVVHSSLGEGSRFVLWFPSRDRPYGAPPPDLPGT